MKKIILLCTTMFGLVLGLANVRPVFAETIVVNTTAQKPGGSGDCTLGEAIDAANTDTAVDGCIAGSGADTITVPAGTYTLNEKDDFISFIGATGLPVIKSEITISGAGAETTIIERNPNAPPFRVLFITGNNAVVRGVTVRGGATQGYYTVSAGIGVEAYEVTIDAVTVSENSGDGLTTLGDVLIKNSQFKHNVGYGIRVHTAHAFPFLDVTVLDSQVIGNTEGGIWAIQTALTIENTIVMNNYGDGISVSAVALTLDNSTVASNTVRGIANEDSSDFMGNPLATLIRNSSILGNGSDGFFAVGEGQMTIEDSAISYNGRDGVSIRKTYFALSRSTLAGNNRHGLFMRGDGTRNVHNDSIAKNGGGGIFSRGGAFAVSVVNTTISDNHGGLVVKRGGVFKIVNSTIARNSAKYGGGIFQNPKKSSYVDIENSIVADNYAQRGSDCFGKLVSLGHNVFGNLKKCRVTLQEGDQVANPQLDRWSDNGAPGNGHYPLQPTSPAIDAADSTSCPATDQLGNPRVGVCDVGAIEYAPAP